jgi:hypothetical protein
MDTTETRSENSTGNGEKQTSEEPKKGWNADRVATEIITLLGHKVRDVAGKIREDSLHEAVRSTTNKVADRLESAGSYLEERKVENMVDDVVSVIRKYPVQSVLLGVAAGFFLSRRGR